MSKTITRTFSKNTSIYWVGDKHRNAIYIKAQERWLADRLNVNGYLFINDVLDALGLKLRRDGYCYGWVDIDKFAVNIREHDGKLVVDICGCDDINYNGAWYSKHLKTRKGLI